MRASDRTETFRPLQDKTLHSVLRQRFIHDFGYGDAPVLADAIIGEILQTLAAYLQPATVLEPGQLLWLAVAHDGRKHSHQRMREIPMVPVILDLVTGEELASLSAGTPYRQVRQQRQARLLQQALEQGGVLAQSDLAAIGLLHRKQVGRAIHAYQSEHSCVLPYRGTVQDVGGTITHKVEVIRLFEAGYLEPEICQRLSIEHDLRAVENYVQTYKHVRQLLAKQFSVREVSSILRISLRLVHSYIDILREHHPEVLAHHPDFGPADV